MIDNGTLTTFIQTYFQHPYFKDRSSRQIVCVAAAGERLRAKALQQRGKALPWMLACERFAGVPLELLKVNAKGADLYYYVNPSSAELSSSGAAAGVSNAQVSSCIYIPVDWDFDLPVGPLAILEEAGVRPWCVYRTSNFDKHARYQALIAIEPSAAVDAERVAELAASVFGGDPSVKNAARLSRLPGSVNWKKKALKATAGSGAENVCRLLKLADEGEVYSLPVLEKLLGRFGRRTLSVGLRRVAARYAAGERAAKRAASDSASSSGMKQLLNVPTWKDALAASGSSGGSARVVAGKRHNALAVWSGELANELVRGRIRDDELYPLFVKLARECLADGFGGSSEEKTELKHMVRYCRETAARTRVELEKQRADLVGMLSVLDNSASGNTASLSKARYINKNYVTPAAVEEISDAAEVASREKLDCHTSADVFCAPFLGDTAEWSSFCADYLVLVQRFKKCPDESTPLVQLIVSRLVKLNLARSGCLVLFSVGLSPWGTVVRYSSVVSRDTFRLFLDAVVFGMKACLEDPALRQRLGECEVVRAALAAMLETARKEAEVPGERNADGGVVVDEVAASRAYRAAVGKFFDVSMSGRSLVDLTAKVSVAASGVRGLGDNGSVVAFQNGSFDVSSGEWLADDSGRVPVAAWRRLHNAVYCNFLLDVAREVREEVLGGSCNGSSPLSEEEKCSALIGWMASPSGTPLLGGLLRDMFPDDERAQATALLLCGYSMLYGNPLNRVFLMFGATACGKGAFSKLVRNLVGLSNTRTGRYQHMAREHGGVANWVGRSMVVLDEAEVAKKQDHIAAFALFKAITGGDEIEVRDIYKGERWSMCGAKIWVLSNSPVEYEDIGGAATRRMVPLYVDNSIPAERQESGLPFKILRAEADKIGTLAAVWLRAHWALGTAMFEVVGRDSRAMRDGSAKLEATTNALRNVLRRSLIASPDSSVMIPGAVLTAAVEALLEIAGQGQSTGVIRQNIGAEMKVLFPWVQHKAAREGRAVSKVWTGVCFDPARILEEFDLDIVDWLKGYLQSRITLREGSAKLLKIITAAQAKTVLK